MIDLRPGTLDDLDAITAIYNEAILNTTATFDTEPKTREQQISWFEKHGSNHPIFVAIKGGDLVGWGSLSPWSDRCAYSETSEISFYVKDGFRGLGVGRRILEKLDQEAVVLGLHSLVSRITAESAASLRLHESVGFSRVGVMREVGRKFGRRLDVVILQKLYGKAASILGSADSSGV
jgi:L-amino acid N-acyltransferase